MAFRLRSVRRRAVVPLAVPLAGAVAAATLAAVPAAPAAPAPPAGTADWSACLEGSSARQEVFERAARVSGVPAEVLLAVSYMKSRWDAHGASPSTSGGYGPMHLTDLTDAVEAHADPLGKGEDDSAPTPAPRAGESAMDAEVMRTLEMAHDLTGIDRSALRRDPVANICGGAALLAGYQAEQGGADDLGDWSAAVARYSGSADRPSAHRFAEQVFATLRTGQARVSNDGHPVRLDAVPDAAVDQAAIRSLDLVEPTSAATDCPSGLACEWIPAPYEWYGEPSVTAYGNHDLADRPHDMEIDYIIIHDTEATWNTTLDLVTRANYLGWHYSLRSMDGHVAQHIDNRNIGWHAGNWYVNTHSIGLEHEGFAAAGASWYTESLYQTSAELVRHLTDKYDIPRDRAHIIGHDQIPAITAARVPAMHWDPGPFWDWEHYMELVGAPLRPDRRGPSDIVTVAPGFDGNVQEIVGCTSAGVPCAEQGSNFVYLHTRPDASSPLVKDPGLRPNGAHSTRQVSDIGARAAAGQKFLVAERRGDWIGVWYLGEIAWMHSPKADPVVLPSQGRVVVAAGDAPVPVYGRALPEAAAYPAEIPFQAWTPLPYTLKPGQAYVVADDDIQTDYYYARSYDCAHLALDCTQVVGEATYYLIWFGHRLAYVNAADVEVRAG